MIGLRPSAPRRRVRPAAPRPAGRSRRSSPSRPSRSRAPRRARPGRSGGGRRGRPGGVGVDRLAIEDRLEHRAGPRPARRPPARRGVELDRSEAATQPVEELVVRGRPRRPRPRPSVAATTVRPSGPASVTIAISAAACVQCAKPPAVAPACCYTPRSMTNRPSPDPTATEIQLPDRGHDLRLVREPHRALPAEHPGRGDGDGQPGHRDGDHPLPAGRRRPRPTSSARSRPRATTSAPRPAATAAAAPISLLEELSADDARARSREERSLLRQAVASIARRGRDHGRDVRPADDRPDGDHQLARPRAGHDHPGLGRRGGSTARRGAPPATARRTWTRSSRSARPPRGRTASS